MLHVFCERSPGVIEARARAGFDAPPIAPRSKTSSSRDRKERHERITVACPNLVKRFGDFVAVDRRLARGSPRARSSASSAPTARASPPPSASSAACSTPTSGSAVVQRLRRGARPRTRPHATSATCRRSSRSTTISRWRRTSISSAASTACPARTPRGAQGLRAARWPASPDAAATMTRAALRRLEAAAGARLRDPARSADSLPRRADLRRRPDRAPRLLGPDLRALRRRPHHLRQHALHGRGRVLPPPRADVPRQVIASDPRRSARSDTSIRPTARDHALEGARWRRRVFGGGLHRTRRGGRDARIEASRRLASARTHGHDSRTKEGRCAYPLPRLIGRSTSRMARLARSPLLLLAAVRLRAQPGRGPHSHPDLRPGPDSAQSRELIARFRGLALLRDRGPDANGYASIERGIDRSQHPAGRRDPAELFGSDLAAGQEAKVQLLLDGSDSNTASIALGYAEGLILDLLPGTPRPRDAQPRGAASIDAARRRRASASGTTARSNRKNYIVPGLIAVILMIIAALLTSLTIAREWEIGHHGAVALHAAAPAEIAARQDAGVLRARHGGHGHRHCRRRGRVRRAAPRQHRCCSSAPACLFLFGALFWGIFLSAATRIAAAGLPDGHSRARSCRRSCFRLHLSRSRPCRR